MNIVLAGNPNSGKTTLFNRLTGSNQHIGNWPGVTVEKKEGKLKNHKDITIIDLPGIYSLSPYSLEEVISRNYLLEEKPDLIINIIDGSNLERNLYLTTQLSETGIPMILAINMMDIVEKNEDVIKTEILGNFFNSDVVEITAINYKSVDRLIEKIMEVSKKPFTYKPSQWFSMDVEAVISEISDLIKDYVEPNLLRWYAIKLFENDEATIKKKVFPLEVNEKIRNIINAFKHDDDIESMITQKRYAHISRICKKVYLKNKIRKEKTSHKIDRILTNRYAALPIFAIIIFMVYYLSISTVGGILTDFVNDGIFGDGGIPDIVGGWLENAPAWLSGIIVDGMIGGVGAVLGFLPQMFVLFILLGILEESGYMARIAFILDRLFRKFGLSGKSFIPMLISTGCAIPGVTASRTIEDETDRKMTIMTTTFMPCGAKLPIIALIAGALFSNAPAGWLVAPSAYFIGIGTVIISGIILKKFKAFAGEPAPFIMELPDYHLPRVKSLGMHVWHKLKSFVVRAGTIILASSVIVWFFSSFSFSLQMVDSVEDSILSSIGQLISWIFSPLGWGDWKAAVATITGLVAKENVVGTFGVLYGFAEVAEDGSEIWSVLANDFTGLTAYSFLIFNLICAPCFAAIGAIKREMGNAKWTWIAIGFQTAMAYILALIVYQVGRIFVGDFAFGSIIGIIALATLVYLIFRKNKYKKKTI